MVLNVSLKLLPRTTTQAPFSGSFDQISGDIKAVKAFGPDEMILDVTFSPDSQNEEGFTRNLERLRPLL
jgi:hypothetical protein